MRAPNAYVLVFAILCLVGALTWLVPPGQFARETRTIAGTTRQVVVENSYTRLARDSDTAQTPFDWVQAPMKGFEAAAEVIGFILLVGGAFGVLHGTGAVVAGLAWLTRRVGRRGRAAAIPILMFAFSLGGATFGMSEETIPFVLVTVPLACAMRFDTITGVAIPFVGAAVGFATAFLNPFTLGIAKGIAEQPMAEGQGYRVLCWALTTGIASAIVTWRALRIANGKLTSPTEALDAQWRSDFDRQGDASGAFDRRHGVTLAVFAATIAAVAIGSTEFGWYIHEIAGVFVAMAIVTGITGGLRPGAIADAFVGGVRDLAGAAVMVAFARGILVVANDGKIVDTMLDAAASTLQTFGPDVGAQAMFVAHTGINFFVPSGSGQAALTMPIMTPLADLLAMPREQAILAYQFGDGFSNMIIPTSPVLMSVLAAARLNYAVWFRWMLPIQLLFFALAIVMIAASPFTRT